jgi:hypothetical protein
VPVWWLVGERFHHAFPIPTQSVRVVYSLGE